MNNTIIDNSKTDRSVDEIVNMLIDNITPDNHESQLKEINYQLRTYLDHNVINIPHYKVLETAVRYRINELKMKVEPKQETKQEPKPYVPPHHHIISEKKEPAERLIPITFNYDSDDKSRERRLKSLATQLKKGYLN